MADSGSAYRQIIKATTIYGGVQAVQLVLMLVRSKVIAVLLGPAGMGFAGVLTSSTDLVANLTGLGLGFSAVKDVAAAHASGDAQEMAKTVAAFRRWVWLTGVAGMALTLAASAWLSEFAFGDARHSGEFMLLSVTLLLGQLGAGRTVLLQGTRNLGLLAKASVYGGVASLAAALPFYLALGERGIVPAIVASSVIAVAISTTFARRIPVPAASLSWAETMSRGKSLIGMGVVVTLNNLLLVACAWILRVWLTRHGSLADAGLYSAGFGVLNTFIGMFFTAMVTDFYPRLAGAVARGDDWRAATEDQAEFAVAVLAPVLALFVVAVPAVVELLYSSKFAAITPMMRWGALGVLFKAASWPVGFLFVPRGDARLFLVSEVLGNLYSLGLSIAGYAMFGLEGLGVAYVAGYLLYFAQVAILARVRYQFSYTASFQRDLAGAIALVGLAAAAMRWLPALAAYALGALLVAASCAHGWRMIDRRIDLRGEVAKLRARLRRRAAGD